MPIWLRFKLRNSRQLVCHENYNILNITCYHVYRGPFASRKILNIRLSDVCFSTSMKMIKIEVLDFICLHITGESLDSFYFSHFLTLIEFQFEFPVLLAFRKFDFPALFDSFGSSFWIFPHFLTFGNFLTTFWSTIK